MSENKRQFPAATFDSATMPVAELEYCTNLQETPTAQVPKHSRNDLAPAQLAHIVFQTNKIEEMRTWWRTVLAGAPLFSSNEMEFISFDEEHHRVALIKRNAVAEKSSEMTTAGFHHVAFSYRSLEHLIVTYRRLKTEGIVPVRTIHHGVTISNYYLDPDNNRVELQVDAFRDAESLNAWLAERGFNDNPVGILFDFEELVRRFDAGEPEEQLLRPLTVVRGG